jgi:hypothetical protein
MRSLINVFLILVISTACSSEIETFTIEREGLLTFSVEGYQEPWQSRSMRFNPGSLVVRVFEDDPPEIILFRRYNLIFEGANPDGIGFELAITLDLDDRSDMRHIYTTDYSRVKGGLHQISLILIEEGYMLAELCEDAKTEAFFSITRQNPEENLIAGFFDAELCVISNQDSRLHISNAQFKDIEYK